MLVPSPPFSLRTTTCPSAEPSASGRPSELGQVGERPKLGLRQQALLAPAQALLVVRERVDRDLGQPLGPHLVGGRAHRADPRAASVHAVITTATEADLPELLPLMRGYCDFYEVDPSDDALLAMSRTLIADPELEGVQLIARDDDGQAVGFATIFWTWTTLSASRLAVMNDLFVVADARGDGHADALIAECVERARARGATELGVADRARTTPARRRSTRASARRATSAGSTTRWTWRPAPPRRTRRRAPRPAPGRARRASSARAPRASSRWSPRPRARRRSRRSTCRARSA